MAHPQTAPCVNINDEMVEIVDLAVKAGDFVRRGDVYGAVETDKAVVDLEAERDGYVLAVLCAPKQKVRVGSVILWLGDSPDVAVPRQEVDAAPVRRAGIEPTAKARALLTRYALDANQIEAAGDRLTAEEVEAWVARNKQPAPANASVAGPAIHADAAPDVAGELQDLGAGAAGMLQTVMWHRDHAAAAYLEIEYDPAPWEAHAAAYASGHRLMLSPLLPLLAFRLVTLAREHPAINATVVGGRRYQYHPINLGFTVQAGTTLYLVVVRDAQAMAAPAFIDALGAAQRHALGHKLRREESTGATLAFSSMARWNVARHIPILPPRTSFIAAHAASKATGRTVLGATYDHRLLSGFDVVQVLQAMSRPSP